MFAWTGRWDDVEIFNQQFVLTIESFDIDIDSVSVMEDIPSQFPETMDSTEFLAHLGGASKQLISGELSSLKETCKTVDISRDVGVKARLSFQQALYRLALPKKPFDRETGMKWMRAAALYGHSPAICYASFMLLGSQLESQFPVRLYLSLLALSHSDRAMEVLSIRWPSIWQMVRKVILDRPSAYDKAAEKLKTKDLFLMKNLLLYTQQSCLPDRQLSLRESLKYRMADRVENILRGVISVPDWDETIPGLLHGLSSLTDAEAASLATIAYRKGARLDFLATAESPLMTGLDSRNTTLDSLSRLYSPISAAIRRGKPLLASAIFCIHIESDLPIPDFSTALKLSFVLSLYDVSEMLLQLSHQSPGMCQDNQDIWEPTTTIIELMTRFEANTFQLYLERRAMHGAEYDLAYEKTLQLLLADGLDPTEGSSSRTRPLSLAIFWDDIIALKLYIRHIKDRGSDVVTHMRCFGKHEGTTCDDCGALLACIRLGSIHCFELLLENFPDLLAIQDHAADKGLLREACLLPSDTIFFDLLLRAGADFMAKDSGRFTPLFWALSEGNLPTADLIASRCSDPQLKALLGPDQGTGHSMFFDLLRFRNDNRPSQGMSQPLKLVDSFRWLASHTALHLYDSTGSVCFGAILHRTRPSSRKDQLLEAEEFAFLLDIFFDEMDTELRALTLQEASWNGHVEIVKLLLARKINVDTPLGINDSLNIDQFPEFLQVKDFTVLEKMTLRMVTGIPIEIMQGTPHDLKEWENDIQAIRDLLAKAKPEYSEDDHREKLEKLLRSIQKYVAKSPEEMCEQLGVDEARRMNIVKDVKRVGRRGAFTNSWPAPLPSQSSNSEQPHRECTLEEFINPADVWTKAWLLKKEAMVEMETEFRNRIDPNFLERIRSEARCMREEWRLPPGWRFAGFVYAEDGQRVEKALFEELETGLFTYQKPGLYCGGAPNTKPVGTADTQSNDEASTQSNDEVNTQSNEEVNTQAHDETNTQPNEGSNARFESNSIRGFIELMRNLGMRARNQDGQLRLVSLGDGLFFQRGETYSDYTDDNGNTLLHVFARLNIPEAMDMLFSGSIDIERENDGGFTALQVAVRSQQLEAAQILLDRGAQPDRLYPDIGLLPLHASTTEQTPDMAMLLLKGGADPNGKDLDGVPPLHFCLSNSDNPGMVRALIEGGADVNLSSGGHPPLCLAASQGRHSSLELLLSAGADMHDIHHTEGDTSLLHKVAQIGDLRAAGILIDHGAEVNKKDSDLKTPVVEAALYTQGSMVELLCSRGADQDDILKFQFFRKTGDDGKIDRLATHIGENERISVKELGQWQGDGKTYEGWEEWQPPVMAKTGEKKTE